jgi:hypothetical protein
MHVSNKIWFRVIRRLNYAAYRLFILPILFVFIAILPFLFPLNRAMSSPCENPSFAILDSINQEFSACCACEKLPVFGLEWDLTLDNPCSDSSWQISQNNTQLRFNIENSKNCGGTCEEIQSGTAVANITVGNKDVLMNVDFFGVGELQNSDFEKIEFILDSQTIAKAHAAGGGRGCQFGPVVKSYLLPAPYKLLKGTQHKLVVNFTTADDRFHKDCFYQINLKFSAQNYERQ